MQFAAAVSRNPDAEGAAEHLADSIRRQLPGAIDFMAVFLSADHRDDAPMLVARLRHDLSPRVVIGCTCEGIVGGDREIEREPAVSVLAGRLPGVTLSPFHIGIEEWEHLLEDGATERLRRRVGAVGPDGLDTRCFLLLGEPFTTPIVELMAGLEEIASGVPIVGGMASGATGPGESVLLLDGNIYDDGVVGIRMAGPLRVQAIVSQGCRPIGETLLVTRAMDNVISTLGGKNALEVARDMLNALPADDQERLENGLYLGIVINEYQMTFERGDFLVRNVIGADEETGALAIGESLRAGQTVQFHLRDAESADEDLREMMARAAHDDTAPTGGLLFSCNGRGVRLFDLPNHDVRGVLEAVPETPLAGFFAQGELGPVGGRSFIHGQTASIVLFRPEVEEV